ncbi:MAG: YfhO family protein [Pirellulales bacterium]
MLPTLDALGDSTRHVAEPSFANTGALHPLNLVQFVAPYLFQARVVGQNTHELGLYSGAVPFLLCVWLLTQRGRWGRFAPLVWAALALGGAALLLALGEAGGLYRVQQLLPVVNRFRFPCRAIVLVQLALATGAATAFGILWQQHDDRMPNSYRRSDRALLIVLAVSIALAAFGPMVWSDYVADNALVWAGPALIGIGVALIALAQRQVRGAMIALALFTAVDLSTYGLSYSVWQRTSDLQEFAASAPRPPGEPHTRVVAEEVDGLRTGNRMLLAGIARVDGYAGLEPAKRLDYSTCPARQRAGVNYVFVPESRTANTPARWEAISATAPRARLVTRTETFQQVFNRPFDLGLVATEPPLSLAADGPGTVRVTADSPGHLAVDCVEASRQLLVTTESFHRGWVARVDGRVVPVVRVDGDFLGCVVEPGDHLVELQFHPRSLLLGRFVSLGGLGLLLCAFALAARRRPQRRA